MNKSFRTLAVIGLVAAAAFGVSACKWGKGGDKPAVTAEPAPSAAPSSAETTVAPPASGAVVEDTTPASSAAPAKSGEARK